MAANEYVLKLKASGTEKDVHDIDKLYEEYREILAKLKSKDRGTFSLNVLCILCRNLDKVPTWRSRVDNKSLLILTIDCVRETRSLERNDRVKTLACVYHLHRHISKTNPSPPAELVLKLSFMPFESETLLKEYSKTYWNILADRLNFIEKLKGKVSIVKLLPKLTDDATRTIQIYNTFQFCSNILVFLVKKLHYLYSEQHPEELNQVFMKIFETLHRKDDVKAITKISEKDSNELYVKLNDCLYVIAENSSKINYKDSALDSAVRTCITLLGYLSDAYHCFQTFYLNTFCYLLSNKADVTYIETIVNNLEVSCETAEKLGYKMRIYQTYPYLYQLFRLFIESYTSMKNINELTEQIHEKSLKFILYLAMKLRMCEQLFKCENCKARTGIHDSLRLSFLAKNFVTDKFSYKTILPNYYTILKLQYGILNELKVCGCTNYDKYCRKVQTDVHNTAITLNKCGYHEFSMKFFEVYIKFEMRNLKSDVEFKNISRALYNKGICELDCKMYEIALLDAYLSLIFAQSEGLQTDKHMCLVMDIKAKSLKCDEECGDGSDRLQMMTVLGACKCAVENNYYGNLKPFLCNLKFSTLLRHEYSLYAKLWPSIVPIAGVWRSLLELTKDIQLEWLKLENKDVLKDALYSVMLATPSAVRTIINENFKDVVTELLKNFDETPANTPDLKLVHVTLLFMRAEFDLSEASDKYGWKVTESSPDPLEASRTLPQEHAASLQALRAVRGWMLLVQQVDKIKSSWNLASALQVAQLFVYQLLVLGRRARALQLARGCCFVAQRLGDTEAYVTNVGVILSHMNKSSEGLNALLAVAGGYWLQLVRDEQTLDTAVCFVCDAAIFYSRCGALAKAAKLVQTAQAHVLSAQDKYPDVNLELSVGRLLEAQASVCQASGPSALSAANNAQRLYLALNNTASAYCQRRRRGLRVRWRATSATARAGRVAQALGAARRARCAAAAAGGATSGPARAQLLALLVDTFALDEAQVKLDKIKHILGLQPSYEPQTPAQEIKQAAFTPKPDIETMLESLPFKKCQTSPSVPCISVPAFRTPDILKHSGKCTCYACEIPISLIICASVAGLEASMYYRANEYEIARNYFNGAFECSELAADRLRAVIEMYRDDIDGFLVDAVESHYRSELGRVKLEVLLEAAFFEMSQKRFASVDEYVVMIHEIMQETANLSPYLRNEVMNLMTASAHMRRAIRKPGVEGLDVEFDSLKISPGAPPPKTPDSKPARAPEPVKVVVAPEEIPNAKRKVIKLNLDETSSDESEVRSKTRTKKAVFKVPELKACKLSMEDATPVTKPKRKVDVEITPKLLVTQPSQETSPRNEFFTPTTPDQFFTPLTSVKTYTKRSLRQNIVKNLECEFSTPNAKENCTLADKKVAPKSRGKKTEALKRATSPGKLSNKDVVTTRSRQLRNPINFSLDDEKK